MLMLAPESKFSRDYSRARKRFLKAAEAAGAVLSRLPAAPGGNGEELVTDIAWVGSLQPKKALVVVSGIHGVEGFAGSAVQLNALENLPEIQEDMALVFVHVLNPYGMQNLRRVNANNVDLNRNFVFDDRLFGTVPKEYAGLDSLINPKSAPGFDLFSFKILMKILRCGRRVITQAVAGGQYQLPEGLFYGGAQMEPEAVAYHDWLQQSPLGGTERLMVLDLHTGLGGLGEQVLFMRSESVGHKELSKALKVPVTSGDVSPGVTSYEHAGGSSGVYRKLFPDRELTCITVEYGTCRDVEILSALRTENQAHHHGRPKASKKAKQRLKDVFCPRQDIWRKRVVIQGQELLGNAIRFLGEPKANRAEIG